MQRHIPLAAMFLTACGGLSAVGVGTTECDPAVDLTCDPTTYTTPPGGEDCNDGADNDGDGDADCEDSDCVSRPACDADGDGYADEAKGGDDCDDGDPNVNPGAEEICDSLDNNCDGTDDEDSDGDGSDACEDCDNQDAAIYPGAADVCDDSVDSNCDGLDCADWGNDFETGSIGGGLVTSGLTPMWMISNTSYTGAFAVQNADIGASGSSCMQVGLTYAAYGTISFWHSENSELGYDYLRFRIDGYEPISGGAWSGITGWTWHSFPVNAGAHTMTWCYEKDGSVDAGTDTVFVDEIVAVGGSL